MKIVISLNWAYRNWHLVSFCISIERQNWKSGIWRWDWYWVIVTESRLSSKSVVWTWTYNFVKVLKFHKNILMLGVRCLLYFVTAGYIRTHLLNNHGLWSIHLAFPSKLIFIILENQISKNLSSIIYMSKIRFGGYLGLQFSICKNIKIWTR